MEIILRWQIHPFSCLLYFRALMTSKRAEKLRGLLFWKEEDFGAKERKKRSPEGRKGWDYAATPPGRVGPPILASVAPLAWVFFAKLRLDLKLRL